ncbi:DUF1638 domain-containing protein [Rhizobiaceae bacterium]|nr:DUF1638 domain-containing protein [Rhizobiaceae bacterium]
MSDSVDDVSQTVGVGNGSPRAGLRVIACGALAREVLAISHANQLDHIDLVCLPAILHNHPERIAPAVDVSIAEARAQGYDRVFVAYADCGTGGALDKVCAAHGVERIAGPHCYAFFSGLDAFASLDEIDAFYLTDFLARQFEAFVVAPLKLREHPELIPMMFGHYHSVVYLEQAPDPALLAAARRAAEFLGLAFEHRHTGYGELTDALTAAG